MSGVLSFVVAKVSFAVGILSLAFIYLAKLARPGGERKPRSYLVGVPFLVIAALAVISLGLAPSSHWNKMIVGDEWLECLVFIPVVAIIPFAVSIWAVRRAAPTSLVRAGALAGLVAGGVCSMAYALHCTDDSFAIRSGLVRWHDCAVRVSRRSNGTAAVALVTDSRFTSA